ncbi:hypothetical protein BC941DRAFT_351317 [Chlamydoabsidia padenii]|nr:hypothetical protein BC941DRAFT_351317 [Chlamydoabsidia padenii]
MSDTFELPVCEPHHDATSLYISGFLCIGLVVSYLPQHHRIISNKTSEGFSPWFLLLGVVSSTSSFFNIILLQWHDIICCQSLAAGSCLESLMGVIQIGIQWMMFSLVFALFLVYFPDDRKRHQSSHAVISNEWKVSLTIAGLCLGHLALSFFISLGLLSFVGGPDNHRWTNLWAGFLGILSMILAGMQYLPQIWKTWKQKSVGALSIPMMMLQTPGTALFVYSLMNRQGINWTAWITYLVTGVLQGMLLSLCIAWYFRNKSLADKESSNLPLSSSGETSQLLIVSH